MKLDPEALASDIKSSLEELLPGAFKEAQRSVCPVESDEFNKKAEEYGKVFARIFAKPFADSLAYSIDAYVKNGAITGTIVTTGTPATQTAKIVDAGRVIVAGIIPNTLKIS